MDRKDRIKLLSDLIKINTVGGREEERPNIFLDIWKVMGFTVRQLRLNQGDLI